MRARLFFLGTAIVVASSAAVVTACSDDDAKSPAASTTSDSGDDSASPGATDAAEEQKDATGGGGTDGGDAGVVEQVTARFGGTTYKLKVVTAAGVNGEGVTVLSATEGVDGGAALDLFFEPKTGTTACGAGSKASLVFSVSPELVYRANETTGTCSVVVNAFGAAGSVMAGTFSATTKKDADTLQGTGSFSVTRSE